MNTIYIFLFLDSSFVKCRVGFKQSITRPSSYLRGQHTQAHASLMPHRGTIWWKNAKRLLDCDTVLQAPAYFDSSSPTLSRPRFIIYLDLCPDEPGSTGLTSHWAVSVPVWQRKEESHHIHIFPQKAILLGSFKSLHSGMKNRNTSATVHKEVDGQL